MKDFFKRIKKAILKWHYETELQEIYFRMAIEDFPLHILEENEAYYVQKLKELQNI